MGAVSGSMREASKTLLTGTLGNQLLAAFTRYMIGAGGRMREKSKAPERPMSPENRVGNLATVCAAINPPKLFPIKNLVGTFSYRGSECMIS
mmetsp:Transcript_47302/g.125633  ORF Transcript_47302/g.125633 Transcript_47302/m.125633 type:complete len:92 (+) Transcript_47302:317-592(+)